MTVSHRKREHQPDEIQSERPLATPRLFCPTVFLTVCMLRNLVAVNEPGLQIQCDSCMCDLTHSVRVKCADPVCEPGDGVDICPACFCAGKEFSKHKRGHPYRVIVSSSIEALALLSLIWTFLRNYTRIQSSQMTGAPMSMLSFLHTNTISLQLCDTLGSYC